jgi:hypothetical protein
MAAFLEAFLEAFPGLRSDSWQLDDLESCLMLLRTTAMAQLHKTNSLEGKCHSLLTCFFVTHQVPGDQHERKWSWLMAFNSIVTSLEQLQ